MNDQSTETEQAKDEPIGQSELFDLARYRVTALSDDIIAISHWVADHHVELARERIVTANQNLQLLAGYLSKL